MAVESDAVGAARFDAGSVLAERYELRRLIGRGGMAEVWEARDRQLDRTVAVKLLDARFAHDAPTRNRFADEGRSAARVNHPNAVLVHDTGEHEQRPFLVMECLPGTTLADELRDGPLPITRVHAVADDLLAALAAAHQLGIVHRDVKPANVLVAADGTVKLADFGIAKSLDEDSGRTLTGQVLGTMEYVAPERLEGRAATPASDVYSLGVLLYEALTGSVPHGGASAVDLLRSIKSGHVDRVEERRPDVDADLAYVVHRALEVDPDGRWADAPTMRAALTRPDVQPTVAVDAVGDTRAMPVPVPARTDAIAPADEPVVDAGAEIAPRVATTLRRPHVRRSLVVAILVAAVIACVIAFVSSRDDDGSTVPIAPDEPRVTQPGEPREQLPPSLDDALDALEEAVEG